MEENDEIEIMQEIGEVDLKNSTNFSDSKKFGDIAPPPPPVSKGVLGLFGDLLRNNVPIALGAFLCYLIGVMKQNSILVIILFMIIWRLQVTYFSIGFNNYLKLNEREEENDSKFSLKSKESSEWLNVLIAAVYPNINTMLNSGVQSFLNNYLNNMIKTTLQPMDPTKPKPSFIIVKSFFFSF